ncbi:hypothetical protein BDW69DRAFT_187367 [Aspergillus filifer]
MHLTAPPVVLDYTLEDLYSLDGGQASNIVLAYAFPASRAEVEGFCPLSQMFTCQNPLLDISTRELIVEHLKSVPQQCGFIADNIETIPLSSTLHRDDALGVYQQLCPSQRLSMTFKRPLDIKLRPNFRIAIIDPVDCLEHLPHHNPAFQPQSQQVIRCQIRLDQLNNPQDVASEIQRMLSHVYTAPLPFVIKVPQANTSEGTFIVKTETDRHSSSSILQDELQRMIHEMSPSNYHLNDCGLILQDSIPGPSIALSLFVTRSGRCIFISCARQVFDAAGLWAGGRISYAEQDTLGADLEPLSARVARYLHGHGYRRPFGIDVIFGSDSKSNGSTSTEQPLVIDLNVRVMGTHALGCLRGHFVERGLYEAAMIPMLEVHCTRAVFQGYFSEKMGRGCIVLMSWSTRSGKRPSTAALAIASADGYELEKLLDILDAFDKDRSGSCF